MITPLRKRLLLRPLLDKMSGSILIPDQFNQGQTAEVVSVGTGIKLPVKAGDVVLFHPNAAWTNIEHEGQQFMMMNEEYLLAVMQQS